LQRVNFSRAEGADLESDQVRAFSARTLRQMINSERMSPHQAVLRALIGVSWRTVTLQPRVNF